MQSLKGGVARVDVLPQAAGPLLNAVRRTGTCGAGAWCDGSHAHFSSQGLAHVLKMQVAHEPCGPSQPTSLALSVHTAAVTPPPEVEQRLLCAPCFLFSVSVFPNCLN